MIRRDCVKEIKEETESYTIWTFFYADGAIETVRMSK